MSRMGNASSVLNNALAIESSIAISNPKRLISSSGTTSASVQMMAVTSPDHKNAT